ncbi:zinc finger protein 574 [Trematomus bernacchii]|uniref:zinc finger protein 574 n=1 Tax=Trematomus bernacchii TaxID=40690 RepID=UPI00146BDCBF|nr:zinc finger protein 574 [Trematomus bernacchii]XP_033979848.1 zinc finger protein 574 [Trematomus bernacchii]
MEEQQEETEYVEHQYMCSECHELFNTLEDVLIHQQIHTGQEGDGEGEGGEVMHFEGVPELGQTQQYQCLECGALLVNPEELLQHQEMHMREAGMEVEHQELCEVLETEEGSEGQMSGPVQYQCLDCLALFDSPDTWLEHRRTHSRSSTHSNTQSNTEIVEYVLQEDGTITPLNNVQNYVLSEQQAGEILAQVLAQQQLQQQTRQSVFKPAAPSRSTLLPPVTAAPGSATMHLQILTAQALADNSSSSPSQRRSKLPPLLPALGRGSSGVLENGVQRLELRLAPSVREEQQATEVLVIHPYECSECSLLFQTPEDFLQHQGEHFLCQDKESGEPGVMSGFEEVRGREEATEKVEDIRIRVAEKKAAVWTKPQQCELCSRTFTSVNRLAAHRRVHEQGTHECPECGKVFKKATSMQTHMRTHSGVARYLCVDCGTGFTTEMTLIMHRKSHIADPLHKCQFCNKTFTNMTKYLYHRRTHLNRDSALTPAPIHRNSADTPAPTSTVLAPRRVSLSTLAILQRAREKNSHTTELKINILTSHKEEEMGTPGQDPELTGGEGEQQGEDIEMEVSAPPEGTTIEPQQEKSVTNSAPMGDTGGGVKAIVSPPASSDKTSFSCRTCSKTFPSQLQLVHHRRKTHVTERSFMCGICGKTFKKQIHVRNHIRTHTGERPFQCSDCGKTFSSLANLTRHTLIHSGVRPYRCDVCHRSFSQSSNLRQHSLLHSSAATLCCPDCPATFRWPTKLAAHRYTQHQGSPAPFPCPHCEAGFLTRRQREGHFLELHPTLVQPGTGTEEDNETEAVAGKDLSSKPSTSAETESGDSSGLSRGGLDCNICGKKLNSPANLRLHRLSHFSLGPGRTRCATGKRTKAHQCPICGKLFVSSSGVALHQRVHTGERPFPCQECGKRFRQNTHLREHLRTHSGERPFRCEVCGKGFIQSMHLAEHRRTHTGERPHVCPLCGKAFKTFSNLRNHKKTHARQQRLDEAAVTMETSSAVAVVDPATVELANGQPQIIQIQTSDLQQTQGTPTIMCNEFGETIAIIETSEGGPLPLEQALEIYHSALENGLAMDTVSVDALQLL